MADIKPPGQIRTVEVEVEPLPEEQEDSSGGQEGQEAATTAMEGQREPTEVERDGKEEERPGEVVATGVSGEEEEGSREKQSESEQLASQATPQAPPTLATMAATAAGVTEASPPSHTPPTPPPPQSGGDAPKRPESFGLNHPSPITRLPPLMSPSDDMSGQRSPGSGRKKSKPKPLNTKNLMACHQDIARSNRELIEPTTPEFKPTTEWVRICSPSVSYELASMETPNCGEGNLLCLLRESYDCLGNWNPIASHPTLYESCNVRVRVCVWVGGCVCGCVWVGVCGCGCANLCMYNFGSRGFVLYSEAVIC